MRITIEQYKNLTNQITDSKSKYHSNKIVIDGIKFDSRKEGTQYIELKILEKASLIKDLELQKVFILQPGFKKNGTNYRPVTYKADFVYLDLRTNKIVIEDTKGFKTDVYRIKKKMFEYVYPDLEIKEI